MALGGMRDEGLDGMAARLRWDIQLLDIWHGHGTTAVYRVGSGGCDWQSPRLLRHALQFDGSTWKMSVPMMWFSRINSTQRTPSSS